MNTAAFILISILKSLAVIVVLLTAVAYSVWLERKVSARIQNRWGPTGAGPFGLLQPLADGVKFILKEDLTLPQVNKRLFIAAPIIAVVCAITSISVIPFGNWLYIPEISVGHLVHDRSDRYAATICHSVCLIRNTGIRHLREREAVRIPILDMSSKTPSPNPSVAINNDIGV